MRSRLLTAKIIGGLAVAILPGALDAGTEGVGLSAAWEAACCANAALFAPTGESAGGGTAVVPVQAAEEPARPRFHSAPRGPAAAEAASMTDAGGAPSVPPASVVVPPGGPGTGEARSVDRVAPPVTDAAPALSETVVVGGVRYRVQSPLRPWSILVSPSSNYSRFELRAGDRWANDVGHFPDGRQRAKLRGEARWPDNTDLWISYSLRWTGDMPTTWSNITELHSDLEPGETQGKPPPFSVSISDGQLQLFTRADTRALTTSKVEPTRRFAMSLLPEGQWQHLVMRVKLDPYGNGSLTFWLNGQQMYDSGPIPVGYNDELGPYFKYGLYRGASDLTTVMEFANVEMGSGSLLDRVSHPLPVPA
jgi:hypothetical protein